ncbi:aminotransferase class V-fold PLP-dependent enzyme [Aquisalimonas sp. APHAB1-3]|uniref:aminotransferase class V-fold PLP-dependent enzyme n=1 Tax=unclassified Aquisalimonas TaxID=2644645 RepID=UPI0025C13599|nr:aminotransferase class V-fold PLP-dependent enzyme [Aquisalimonas sp.]
MSAQAPGQEPRQLLEYSVVFTDRSMNHMSAAFQGVMRDLSAGLRRVYGAEAAVVVPGGGTWAMEAVARQFATGQRCLVIRNGWFSYRWTQILDTGGIASAATVLKAQPTTAQHPAAYAPPPVEEAVAAIRAEQPAVVFAPHVETSSGILLPDDYVRALADAAHEVGGLFVLDCIASGALWVDMRALGVDVLISAPQKGWSASPCAGLVMLSAAAEERLAQTTSTSFALDLSKWRAIMRSYEDGGHAYHATMPTDSLARFRDTLRETEAAGLETLRERQIELGKRVRGLLSEHGFASVAAEGFQAPGVVVCHTDNPALHNGRAFADQGLQTAAGVPLMCDEPEDFRTFRIGLFGLDKLQHVDRTVARLEEALAAIAGRE